MAITPDVTTVTIDGVTIGLSDTIANLIQAGEFTIANLQPYMVVGQNTIGNQYYASLSAAERNYTGSGGSTPEWFPVNNTGRLGDVTVEFQTKASVTLPHPAYGRNFLVYGTLNAGGEPQQIRADNMSTSDLRVVTSIDFKKIYYDVEMASVVYNFDSPAGSATYYQTGSQGCVRTIDNDEDASCFVYSIFGDNDDWYCIKDWMFPADDSSNNSWHMSSSQSISGNYGNTYASLGTGYENFTTNKTMFRWINNQIGEIYGGGSWNWNNSGHLVTVNGDIIQACDYSGAGVYGGGCYNIISGLDNALKQLANAGLKFKWNNTWYKPISDGGVVTGYTDDMTEESEWDDIEDVTGNTVPVTPPGPTPPGPGPYDDDPWSGATFAGTGVGGAGVFAKVYYMTSTELANLRSWMNSINVPEGFDPMQQIIGLSQVPVALSGSGPENVVFVNSSAVYDPGVTTRAVDTGVATQQAMGTPISYYLGSVDIVRRMQERGEPYLDYDCQIELYLPLIGMFSLDTQAVMGRTISAYAVLDPVSGTLAAYAYVTKDGQNLPVAYGSTTIGVDLPISAQQLSVSRAALKQANAQLGASLLSGALTMLAAASSSGKSSGAGAKTTTGSSGLSAAGIREAGSDYMKASQVGNVFGDFMQWGRTIRQLSYGNNTAIAGSFGGSTAQWSYPFTPYVKIIRPRFEKPSNYAHSQGVPCVQTKTIGSCTGFIQCIGADVSGITGATDLELQAIQAALSNGIYAGGGQ